MNRIFYATKQPQWANPEESGIFTNCDSPTYDLGEMLIYENIEAIPSDEVLPMMLPGECFKELGGLENLKRINQGG